jgi:hypothetical protein
MKDLNKKWKRLSIAVLLFSLACSSSQKSKKTEPVLARIQGKTVALMAIEGEETAKKVVEVALINQLVRKGTFILVPKHAVEAARAEAEQDPNDWEEIARKVGADFALRVQVDDFAAEDRSGYSTEEVIDSQIAAEQGTDGKTQQTFQVKSLDGHVKLQLLFTELTAGKHPDQTGIAEAKDHFEASAKNSSIHLPPKLRFLEDLTNKAFRDFFDQYN